MVCLATVTGLVADKLLPLPYVATIAAAMTKFVQHEGLCAVGCFALDAVARVFADDRAVTRLKALQAHIPAVVGALTEHFGCLQVS